MPKKQIFENLLGGSFSIWREKKVQFSKIVFTYETFFDYLTPHSFFAHFDFDSGGSKSRTPTESGSKFFERSKKLSPKRGSKITCVEGICSKEKKFLLHTIPYGISGIQKNRRFNLKTWHNSAKIATTDAFKKQHIVGRSPSCTVTGITCYCASCCA